MTMRVSPTNDGFTSILMQLRYQGNENFIAAVSKLIEREQLDVEEIQDEGLYEAVRRYQAELYL